MTGGRLFLLRKSASLSSLKRITTVTSLINAFHFSSPPSSSRSDQYFYSGCAVSDEDKSYDGMDIANLGISQVIVSALAKKGITKLLPVQKAVLEPAMRGRDLICCARTGAGKTLAFAIPIMDKITKFKAKNGRQKGPLALILAPTKELAYQVEKEFSGSAPNLDTIRVHGGSGSIQLQINRLDRGVDAVVGTPGRVIILLKKGALNLSLVQFIVLDEADKMLNVAFAYDVETILEHLPKNCQSMMFSATMPSWKLTPNYLKDPLTIDLVGESDHKLADGITYSIASENYDKTSIIGPLYVKPLKLFREMKSIAAEQRGLLVGLYVGTRFIGLAISDQGYKIASPSRVIVREKDDIEAIANDFQRMISDLPMCALVVWYPYPRVKPTPQGLQVENFIYDLFDTGKLDGLPYTYWNECYTTKKLLPKHIPLERRVDKEIIDNFAAPEILQGYLDFGNSVEVKSD